MSHPASLGRLHQGTLAKPATDEIRLQPAGIQANAHRKLTFAEVIMEFWGAVGHDGAQAWEACNGNYDCLVASNTVCQEHSGTDATVGL